MSRLATERDFSTEKRDKLAKTGAALPDGSFPIQNCGDVANAVKAFGRAKDQAAAKSHIMKRARALGCMDNLPDTWTGKVAHESMRGRDIFLAAEAREFDDEKMEATITIVKPGFSGNHRNHRPDAIRRAVENGIWNNSPMFVDHADNKRMPMKRSFHDLVSGITSTELGSDGRAIGHVKFFDQEFYQKAKEAKDFIGVSMATFFKGKQWHQGGVLYEEVDDYVKNVSVDWVAFPAAGGAIEKFLPAYESEDGVDFDKLTLEDIKSHAPDIYEAIVAEAREATEDPPEKKTAVVKNTSGGDMLSKADVQKLITEAIETAHEGWTKELEDGRKARSEITEFVNKAGLPQKMRNQVIDDLAEKGSFDQKIAQEAVDGAWSILEDAGLKKTTTGPQIKGAGPSGSQNPPKEGERNDLALEEMEGSEALFALESAFGMKKSESGKGAN